jgi:hypothetical protein
MSAKQPMLTVVQPTGIVTLNAELHPANVHSPVALQPTGRETAFSALQPQCTIGEDSPTYYAAYRWFSSCSLLW